MAVPYIFATATSSIPLSQLDSNFSTPITLGNTSIQLGNTVTTLNNMTLANVSISSVASTFPNNYLANSTATLGNSTITLGGTTSSVGNLTLVNATISSGTYSVTNATVSGSLTLSGGTVNGVAYLNGSNVLTTGSVLTFDGTNLGVGTTSPAGLVNVSAFDSSNSVGGSTAAINITNSDESAFSRTSNLIFSTGTGALPTNRIAAITGIYTGFSSSRAGALAFSTDNGSGTFAERARIDSSGNLQIGNTSYAYRVAASRASDGIVGYFRRDGSTVNPALTISCNETGNTVGFGTDYAGATSPAMTFSTQGTERARITSGGDLLVGNTIVLNANARLSVWNSAGSASGIATGYGTTNGQFRLIYLTSANDALNFDNGNNNATLTSGGVWTNASDARIKTNIQEIKYGLETVLSAKPRSYNRVDVEGDYIGFVAQELQEAIPEVVYGNEDTKYSVDYGSLVAVAFKAIQEQQAIIETLTARVAALESK